MPYDDDEEKLGEEIFQMLTLADRTEHVRDGLMRVFAYSEDQAIGTIQRCATWILPDDYARPATLTEAQVLKFWGLIVGEGATPATLEQLLDSGLFVQGPKPGTYLRCPELEAEPFKPRATYRAPRN
jgi:hypothetical protein